MTDRTVRALSLAEVATLVDWAAGEGWNPGLDDAAVFHATDPEGFIGAFVDGEMVAGISAVAYGQRYGFIGLYICRPDRRGEGHGKAVWEAGMARLAGRTIGLDGVDAQFDNYRAKGFAPAYRNTRLAGRFAAQIVKDPAVGVVNGESRPGVLERDRQTFSESRAAFLERWLAPPHLARTVMRDGRVDGFGVMRACRDGWKIGGLSAADDATAELLLHSLASFAHGAVHIDVPNSQEKFSDILRAGGLAPGFETTRMYLGDPVPFSPQLFAVTTLELG